VSGLIFVLLFGAQGLLGPWLIKHDLKSSSPSPASFSPRSSSPFLMVLGAHSLDGVPGE
jgi:hypothetical protein